LNRFVPEGLDSVPIDFIAKSIAALGFNCVRLPYSLESFYRDPKVNTFLLYANKELQDLSSMQLFDKVISILTQTGLMVILSNHVSGARACCSLKDYNGLWYNTSYSQRSFFEALKGMTKRY
jgi:aryl-phospho-beta-D-glucosidase BglC (GH1 family)